MFKIRKKMSMFWATAENMGPNMAGVLQVGLLIMYIWYKCLLLANN